MLFRAAKKPNRSFTQSCYFASGQIKINKHTSIDGFFSNFMKFQDYDYSIIHKLKISLTFCKLKSAFPVHNRPSLVLHGNVFSMKV
jgi:hypothetical protein